MSPSQSSMLNHGAAIPPGKMFIPNGKRLQHPNLELYSLDNFLSNDECFNIVALIKSRLRPSTLSSFQEDQSYRTSRTCDLGCLGDPFMQAIDRRICQLLGLHPSFSEVIQGQYYEIGQQFKAHTDYFESHEMESHGKIMGQRTYTCMIYLNDVEAGGQTEFTRVGASFTPKTGQALIWNSLKPDGSPNPFSMHHAHMVQRGYKAVITKWFRSLSHEAPAPEMFTKEENEYFPPYTQDGLHKTKIPEPLHHKLREFYHTKRPSLTTMAIADNVINTSETNSEKSVLIEISDALRNDLHHSVKPMVEQWCSKRLEPSSIDGIREY